MKLARNVSWWSACTMIAGVAAALLVSTDTARSAERDRAATSSDRAVRVTGTGPSATARKQIRKKQDDAKKKLPPPQ